MKTSTIHFRLHWILILSLVLISCSKEPMPDQKPDSLPPMVNARALDAAFIYAREIGNLRSLVVVQGGKLVREEYFSTGGPNVPQDVRSVTKTVVSLLIGIAIDKGYLTSVNQTIGEFFDPLVYHYTAAKAGIKIRDLLTMSSGFEWDELTTVSGYNDWITSTDQVQYVLDRDLITQPGQHFNYNSGACHLLSVILTKATGMTTESFAYSNLFQPLGIPRRSWQTDKQGFNNGSAGLSLTPYDMVKIGKLIRDRGEYQKKGIVPWRYIAEAVNTKIATNNSMAFASGYGYCLWTGQSNSGNYSFANGYGGQFIVVVPDLNLVVVAQNQWSGVAGAMANEQWYRTMDIIITRILTSFSAVSASPVEWDNT
jgi:CubicO group peptidase (beta-lactamase class C family)